MSPTTTEESHEEERARLESERDVLLKSLDDLESERAAGGIDDESYRALHDDYTARAAAVIRALRDGVDTRPEPEKAPPRRRVVVIGAIVVFAIGAGFALAAALGARLPGETSSGNTGVQHPSSGGSTNAALRRLQNAVANTPNDISLRLRLAIELEARNKIAAALRQYDAVIHIAPTDAEAYAQSGRLLYLAAQGSAGTSDAATLVDQSKARLDKAIELDPTYPDARFFRAIVLANEFGDFRGAQSDLQHYLALAPNGQFVDQARQLLADVTNALESTTTTT